MLGVLALAGWLVVGCTSEGARQAGSPMRDSAGGSAEAPNRSVPDTQESAPGSGSDNSRRENVSGKDLVQHDRKLARTASATLRARDVEAAAGQARDIATDLGGYVGSERTSDDSARLTLNVPGEKLDQALDRLAKIGTLTSREVSVEDVTDSVVDVDSRITSQRKSVARARALLDKAESISEIVTVEEELASREAELESLLARQQSLAGQAAMAPVHVTILQRSAPPADSDDDTGFLAGLTGGWDAFTSVLARHRDRYRGRRAVPAHAGRARPRRGALAAPAPQAQASHTELISTDAG